MRSSSILNYKGLYGDRIGLPSSDFFQHESLETRSKVYDWEIKEHLHSELFQLFSISEGDGHFISEQKELTIQAPCIITVPANALHGFQFESNIKGDVFTFSQKIIESLRFLKKEHLRAIGHFQMSSLSEHLKNIEDLLNIIIVEISHQKSGMADAIKALLEVLFIQINRLGGENERQEMVARNRYLSNYQSFIELIRRSDNNKKSIADYATEMNLSTVHLNRVCQMVAGKTASEVVKEYLIQAAKNYLLNTSYSISEIAYFLNFNDPAYFNRIFKKHVGATPGEFRRG